MPICLNVQDWRASTRSEIVEFLARSDKPGRKKRHLLAVRRHLKPVDVYSYLRARFGTPNGFQNVLRRDDSDNLVHWDFQLKAGTEDVYICGHLREVHMIVSEALSDEEWQMLIRNIKSDYSRVSRKKSAMVRTFEKYILFQNKYALLASLCAELHERILDAPKPVKIEYPGPNDKNLDKFKASTDERAKRAERLFGDCLKLRLVMPVMAEAYINMLILTFCRSQIRDDNALYENFLRTKFPERLYLLSENCDGFRKAVDKTVPGLADFMRIMNRRNFSLHGNVDPMREPIEPVYFEGKRPLFVNPGNNIELLFDYLETQANPTQLLDEYEKLHGFLYELSECLTPRHKRFFEQVVSDSYPGFRTDVRRPTRLFPDHHLWSGFPGIRYDDQLDVRW